VAARDVQNKAARAQSTWARKSERAFEFELGMGLCDYFLIFIFSSNVQREMFFFLQKIFNRVRFEKRKQQHVYAFKRRENHCGGKLSVTVGKIGNARIQYRRCQSII